ncbi:MAG: UbiX family flavin prenyltransferase [Planctomycetales bacterium]|nr:UbiX family flavin prenyltransferase [Planctomycetales bacterium]
MTVATRPIVVGVTGASGAAYALRMLEWLAESGHRAHLTISPSGRAVLSHEAGRLVDLEQFEPAELGESIAAAFARGQFAYHHFRDMMSPLASGSFLTQGMVICPCSGGTLSGVAHGTSDNLIKRAADVHLKERRKLVLVPRETPLGRVHLENMLKAHDAGAVVLPASPGWYHEPASTADLVDFIVARVLDQLDVPHDLVARWGEPREVRS